MNTSQNLNAETNSGTKYAEEVADFYVEEDGNGGKYKVMNLDHPKWAKTEGVVEIAPLKFAKGLPNARTGIIPNRHENAATFKMITCRKNKYIVGVPTGRNDKGQITWMSFTFKDSEFLNLANPEERRRYVVFLHSPIYIDSPNFIKGSKTEYGINDRELQNEKFFEERTKRVKAGEIASSLRGDQLNEMALLIGLDPNTMSTTHVQRKVVEFAENGIKDKVTGKTGSETFLDLWFSPSRAEWTTFKRALTSGVITYDAANSTYNYQNLPIGRAEEEVVAYLKRNPVQYTSIDMQSRRIDGGSTKFEIEPPTPTSTIGDDRDAIIARQEERLKNLEALLMDASKKAIKADTESKVAEEDPEYAAMLIEASDKTLGAVVKGAHLIGRGKSIEEKKLLLRKKIDETRKLKNN